jgi:hypothetical protein
MHRLIVITVALLLSTPWGAAIVRATAKASGVQTQQSPAPPPPPADPTTEGGASWDPWGTPQG